MVTRRPSIGQPTSDGWTLPPWLISGRPPKPSVTTEMNRQLREDGPEAPSLGERKEYNAKLHMVYRAEGAMELLAEGRLLDRIRWVAVAFIGAGLLVAAGSVVLLFGA